jgi:hypothetical protein
VSNRCNDFTSVLGPPFIQPLTAVVIAGKLLVGPVWALPQQPETLEKASSLKPLCRTVVHLPRRQLLILGSLLDCDDDASLLSVSVDLPNNWPALAGWSVSHPSFGNFFELVKQG